MSTVEKSVDVNVPIQTAYNQWTQFEEFPRFMEGVKSVTQTDDTHLHWVAEVAGKEKEWDAEITEQHADERIAWMTTRRASRFSSTWSRRGQWSRSGRRLGSFSDA